MKREIKFRAWDKQRHHMLDVEELAYNLRGELVSIYGFGRDFSNDPDALLGEEPDLDRAVLMEYTGLHDKNGRSIYEGDIIVTHPKSKYEAPKSGVVQFGDSCPSFIYKVKDGREYDIWSSNVFRTYEVIGNIFENPELLEEEQ
ncbi:YopX family protein [Lacticaseibacillus paracasei]|uniref:YopX family protein n=1 Tax=Lacticaseibacillus paracasei TaxID=1597 RepID=UPI0022EC2CAA|nr:YopX family protein [Lacticaseibacillus paracasei]WBS98116.1 YopX family protein [Lacticaseibacillus paracasei]